MATSRGFSELYNGYYFVRYLREQDARFVLPPFIELPMNEIERGTWPLHLGNVELNSLCHPRTILAFLFSLRRAAFYHCVQSEAQWGFQAKNLNFTFCLYLWDSSRLQVLQVTMATSRALMNELLTTVQPTSQEEEEEEPNHLVSATYYENNTDSRESLSSTVIPTLGSLCSI